jgi:hypothetical protein
MESEINNPYSKDLANPLEERERSIGEGGGVAQGGKNSHTREIIKSLWQVVSVKTKPHFSWTAHKSSHKLIKPNASGDRRQ